MARISTYAIDGTPVSSDKLIGTDSSGTTTKNYPLGSVSDWLKESGASAVLGQNNYSFQIALDPDAGRLPGSFSFENYGGDGTEFTDVSRLMVSNLSSTGKYVGDYLLSTVGDRVMLGQLDDLNSFGVYTLVSLVQNPIEPTFYDAELLFVEGNGALLGNKLYGLATYSASASAESAVWGSIEGTVTNQTDLVDYIDAEIAAIPVPITPTLQSVTDEGNTTTNNIGIGTTSPSRNLEVSSSGTTTLRIGSTNSFGRGIELYTTGSSTFLDVEGNFSIRKSDSNPLWTADGTVTIANQYFYGGYINFRKRNTTTNLAQIGLEDGSNTYFNTGNVGIGTTAPATGLHVYSTGGIRSESPGNASVQIMRSDNAQYSALLRYYSGNSEKWVAGLTDAGDFTGSTGQEFMVGPLKTTPYLLIDSGGNVAIGKETANFLLDVGDGVNNTFVTKRNPNGNIYIGSSDNTRFGFAGGQVNLGFATGGENNNVPLALGTFSNAQPLILGTDNLERVRIDGPTGNVGIGTTAPSALLEIKSNSTNDFLKLTTGGGGATPVKLIFEKTVNEQGIIEYNRNGNLEIYNTDGDGGVLISGSGSANADMYINHAGNVGIGTTAPSEILQVGNDSVGGNYIQIAKKDNSNSGIKISETGSGRIGFFRVNQSEDLEIGTENSNDVDIFTNGVSRVTIDGDNGATQGYVGIGTTAPAEKLHVDGNIRTSSGTGLGVGIDTIYSNSVNINNSGQYRIGNAEFISKSANDMNIYQGRMWVTNTGNVGIGNTAPLAKLHVKDGNTLTAALSNTSALIEGFSQSILQVASHSTGYSQLAFGDQDDGFDGGLIYSNASRYLAIEAANVERMRFTANGNVGIGTTAPTEKLEVVGYAKASTGFKFGNYGLVYDSSNDVNIKNAAYYHINFHTNNTQRMRITNAGNVGIGTTAPAAKLDVDGQVHLGPQSTTGFPSIDIASSGRTTIRASAPALSVRDENNNGGYIDIGGGTLANINSITSASTLLFSSTNVRFGGDIGSRVNIVGQANSSQKVLGLKQGSSGSNIMIDIRNSSNVPTMGITSEGGFYFRDSNLVSRYTFDHDYSASPADGLTVGIDLRTENASGVVESLGYIDVTQDDISADESSMRLSVGETTPTEVMRLQSNGNVGIGTTAPAEKLDVIGNIKSTKLLLNTTNTGYTFYSNGESRINNITFQSVGNDDYLQKSSNNGRFWIRNGRSGQSILLGANDSNGQLNDYLLIDGNNQELRVRIASSDRFIINSAGNVGVGTTSPTEKIEVTGNVKATRIISSIIREGNNNGHLVTTVVNASNTSTIVGNNATTNTLTLGVKSSGAVTTQGKLGIGTTAPDSKLHVSAASGIAFKVNPNNVDKEWYIDTTNPDHLKKEGNLILNADPTGVHTGTKISFNIDGSNKASINSDGDLGVGTTAQTSKVHVDGTAMRQLRMGTAGGPSSNTDTSGAVGDMAYDDNYFYIKTASGWGRVQLDFGF